MDNECKYLKIEDVTNWHVDKCGTCKHYIGAGDWNLCCDKEFVCSDETPHCCRWLREEEV